MKTWTMRRKLCVKGGWNRLVHVTLAALLLMTVDGADKSPCIVTMTQSATCNNQNIVKIPQDLPDSITTLNVNYNRLEFTDAGDWQRYGLLKILYIKGNQIRSVDEKAFHNLGNLSHIDLSFNRLTNISKYVFKQNMNLATVVLSGNKLWLDPAFPFLISSSIESLHLENCRIWQISSVTFSKMEKLKTLSLYENDILSLDPSSFQYTSLQELYIDPAGELNSTLKKISCDGVTVHCSGSNKVANFCTGWTRKTTRNLDPQTNVEQSLSSRAEAELTTQNNNMTDEETQTICNKIVNFCTGWTLKTSRNVDLQTNVEQTLSSRAEAELTTQNNNMTDKKTQTICNKIVNFCTGWTLKTSRNVDLQTNVEQTLSSRTKAELTTQNNNMTENETQTICVDRAWLLITAPIALIIFCVLVILVFSSCRKQKADPGKSCKSSEAPTSQDCDYILVEEAPVPPNVPQKQPLVLPSEDAPRRPLPPPPSQYGTSYVTYNEYEKIDYR